MKKEREPSLVLLWGGKSVGKSGFMGALWDIDAEQGKDGDGVWAISPTDVNVETKEYLKSARDALLDETRAPTMPSESFPLLSVLIRKWQNGNPVGSMPLGFRDPAGEYADDADRARAQGSALLQDMVNAAGIIWLFDCTGQHTPKFTEVMRQLTSVRQRNGGKLVETPLALFLSKIDQLTDEQR